MGVRGVVLLPPDFSVKLRPGQGREVMLEQACIAQPAARALDEAGLHGPARTKEIQGDPLRTGPQDAFRRLSDHMNSPPRRFLRVLGLSFVAFSKVLGPIWIVSQLIAGSNGSGLIHGVPWWLTGIACLALALSFATAMALVSLQYSRTVITVFMTIVVAGIVACMLGSDLKLTIPGLSLLGGLSLLIAVVWIHSVWDYRWDLLRWVTRGEMDS